MKTIKQTLQAIRDATAKEFVSMYEAMKTMTIVAGHDLRVPRVGPMWTTILVVQHSCWYSRRPLVPISLCSFYRPPSDSTELQVLGNGKSGSWRFTSSSEKGQDHGCKPAKSKLACSLPIWLALSGHFRHRAAFVEDKMELEYRRTASGRISTHCRGDREEWPELWTLVPENHSFKAPPSYSCHVRISWKSNLCPRLH